MTGLERQIEERVRGRRVAVVGVGNPLRGDDGAGCEVCRRLRVGSLVPVFDAETVPENYLGDLLGAEPEVVLFVDAADHGAAPGACRLAPVQALAPRAASTHAPSLLLLAGLLERQGIECWLLGIQPAATATGTGLSPAVAQGAAAAADALSAALASALVCEVRHG